MVKKVNASISPSKHPSIQDAPNQWQTPFPKHTKPWKSSNQFYNTVFIGLLFHCCYLLCDGENCVWTTVNKDYSSPIATELHRVSKQILFQGYCRLWINFLRATLFASYPVPVPVLVAIGAIDRGCKRSRGPVVAGAIRSLHQCPYRFRQKRKSPTAAVRCATTLQQVERSVYFYTQKTNS